jgi:hypothetical protein
MRHRRLIAAAVLAATAAAVGAWVYRVFSPSDRVRLSVEHIPAGTRFVCLVASRADGSECLDWYTTNELAFPFTMHPAHAVLSYRIKSDPLRLDCEVRWVPARDYGVVVLGEDGRWRAVWFPAAEVSPNGAWRRRAEFDCTGRPASPLPEAVVRELGLSGVKVMR